MSTSSPSSPGSPVVRRLERSSVANQIFQHLLAEILSMRLKPFQELSEARLAQEFGVSRTPVREAFARLGRLGLVDIYPQVGTTVSPLSAARVDKSRFIREALEKALVRLAAERRTDEQLAQLEREIATQRASADKGDADGFLASDDRLHALIAQAAGYPSLWEDDVHEAKFHMDRVRHLSLLSSERMHELVGEHQDIVGKLREGNPDLAEASIKSHLSSVLDDISIIARQHPEYFQQ